MYTLYCSLSKFFHRIFGFIAFLRLTDNCKLSKSHPFFCIASCLHNVEGNDVIYNDVKSSNVKVNVSQPYITHNEFLSIWRDRTQLVQHNTVTDSEEGIKTDNSLKEFILWTAICTVPFL